MKNIFIIGSKGIPANYGGFETFVEKLTLGKISNSIKYHVSCLANNNEEFEHNKARCFNVKTPNIGPGKAIYYDVKSLSRCIKYIEENNLKNCIIYILACRIGPFMWYFKRKLTKLGVKVFVNPDGHEWMRAKWNKVVRRYWKISEGLMVKHSDLLICDSINIEKYIKKQYSQYSPNTKYIAYGADIKKSNLSNEDDIVRKWYEDKKIKVKEYYLVVGRFVPENNYTLMIEEFMKSNSLKDLVLITNVEKNSFYDELKVKTNFDKDPRIKFVGTVYNEELLKKIRENSFAYFHGHEVGGTNPSLLEALAMTDLNLLLDVGFNREVAENSAIYFSKENGSLKDMIEFVEKLEKSDIDEYSYKSTQVIRNRYSWERIIDNYEEVFNEH